MLSIPFFFNHACNTISPPYILCRVHQRTGGTNVYHDPWRLLGVQRGASCEEIKQAYRRLAKLHHPDSGGDPERFQRVLWAYKELTTTQEYSYLKPPTTRQHRGVVVVYGGAGRSYGPLYRALRRCLKPRLIWQRGTVSLSSPVLFALAIPALGLKFNPLLTLACSTVILCTGRLRIIRY